MSKELFVEKITIIPNWDLIVSGTKFKGCIDKVETEGRILIEGDRAYLCQNDKEGTEASTTLGYSYSWVIDRCELPSDVQLTSLELDPEFVHVSPKVFQVGSYDCKIHTGHIMVGCTKVSNELLREIASNLIDEEK